jgi:hypothetical protein
VRLSARAGLSHERHLSCQGAVSGEVSVTGTAPRMPYEPEPLGYAEAAEMLVFLSGSEIRHTPSSRWSPHILGPERRCPGGLSFDFTGVVFDGGDFTAAVFNGGRVSFYDAEFCGGMVDFSSAVGWSSQPRFLWVGTHSPGSNCRSTSVASLNSPSVRETDALVRGVANSIDGQHGGQPVSFRVTDHRVPCCLDLAGASDRLPPTPAELFLRIPWHQ